LTKARLALIFIIFEAAVLYFGNGMVGLFESSEARYAEVSREMLETGDYISPRMDYVFHFTKPPLAYWLTSLGMAVFGVNPFGVRFFVTLFALLTLWVVFRIGEEEDGSGLEPMVILGAFPLFFVMARILTTDIFLMFFVALGYYLYLLREKGRLGKRSFDILFGLTGGLAVLTKGQVPILYWLLIFGGMAAADRSWKPLKTLCSPVLLATVVLSSGWWFAAVGFRHEGLLQYLFFKESVEAGYSSNRFHPGPFYYYIPVMLGGLFPFWVLMPPLRRLFREPKMARLAGFTFLPLLIWSAFPAKLPTYLLPSAPGWALLLAGPFREGTKRFAAAPFALSAVLSASAVFVAAKSREHLNCGAHAALAVLGVSAAAALAAAILAARRKRDAALAVTFASIVAASLAAPMIISKAPEKFKISEDMSLTISRNMKAGDEVLELRTTAFSVPFYVGKKVYAFENNFFRKKFLGERPSHILEGEEELRAFMSGNPSVWIVADKKSEPFLLENYPSCRLFRKGERYIIYVTPAIWERERAQAPQPQER